MKVRLILFLLIPLLSFGLQSQEVFPTIKAKTLTKEKITIPQDLDGQVNIIILAFEQKAQRIIDTWAKVILKEYEPQENITYYEIPMISGWYSPMGFQIDNWMRGGIPEEYHDNTATFYGNRQYIFEELNIKDKSNCYLFVLNHKGEIQYRTEDGISPETEKEFRTSVMKLLDNY